MGKITNEQISLLLSLETSEAQKNIINTTSDLKRFTAENKVLTKELKVAERDIKKIASAMTKLEKSGKVDTEQYKILSANFDSATTAVAKYTQQIKENEDATESAEKNRKKSLDSLKLEEMTMSQLQTRASHLQKQLQHTSVATNPQAYKKLQKELDNTQGAMTKLSGAGKGMIGSISSMPGVVGAVSTSVTGLGQALKLLAANPIGAVIMIIVGAFMFLKEAITSSEGNMNKFMQLIAPLQRMFSGLMNMVQKAAGVILDFINSAIDGFMKMLEWLPFVGDKMKEINETNREAIQLEKDKLKLKQDERKWAVESAKIEEEVAGLRNKAQQRDKFSAKERLAFIDQAFAKEKLLADGQKKIAQERLRQAELEASWSDNDEAVNDNLAALTAEIVKVDTAYNQKTMEMAEKRVSFMNELKTEQIKIERDGLSAITSAMGSELKKQQMLIKTNAMQRQQGDVETNLQLLELDKKSKENLVNNYKDYLKKVSDPAIRKGMITKIGETELSILGINKNIDTQKLAIHKEGLDKQLEQLGANNQAQKVELEKDRIEGKISQEQYDNMLMAIDAVYLDEQLKAHKKYNKELLELDISNSLLKQEAVKNSTNNIVKIESDAAIQRAKVEEILANTLFDFQTQNALLSEKDLLKIQLSFLDETYKAKKALMEKEGLSALELTAAFEQAKTNIILDAEDQRFQMRQQLGQVTWQEEHNVHMDNLKKLLDEKKITEAEYDKVTSDAKMEGGKKYFDQFAGMASGAVQALQQAEMDSVDVKYDAQIAAAGDNAEEVARLEEEKAKKKLDIEKKYADVNFAIKASEIIANTAVAIMQGFAQMGPIAGGIAAVLMGATGAAQLVSANAERKKIKNMTINSSSSTGSVSQRVVGAEDGGYIDVVREQDGRMFNAKVNTSARGFITKPTVLVAENGQEFVVNNEAVNNPQVRPILDIIDRAQRGGYAKDLNLSAISASIATPGFQAGGWVNKQNSSPSINTTTAIENNDINKQLLEIFQDVKKNGIKAPIVLTELQKKLALLEESDNIGKK